MVDQSSSPGSSPKDLDDGLSSLGFASQEEVDDQQRALDMVRHPQRIILPEGASKADAIHLLSKEIPQNSYGLPTYFYRSDWLPYPLTQLTNADADAAAVQLDYSEGYPTYMNGRIFWQQMPHEPFGDFQVFQRYLDQAEDLGVRQLQLLSMDQLVSLERISEMAREYLWQARARAYDLFQVAAEKKKRELRARKVENADYTQSTNLLNALLQKFDDPEWINQLSHKEAIDAMMDLIKIRRISLGLSSNGNAGPASDNPNAGAGVELIMREITKKIGAGEDQGGLTPELLDNLGDSDFTMKAQELIFRMMRPGTDGQS